MVSGDISTDLGFKFLWMIKMTEVNNLPQNYLSYAQNILEVFKVTISRGFFQTFLNYVVFYSFNDESDGYSRDEHRKDPCY